MNIEITKSKHERTWGYYETLFNGHSVFRRNRRASELPSGHSICYLSIVDESILENLENRSNRPHVVLRPYVLEALHAAGVTVSALRWSQKAGCSCGCSPGWIMQGANPGQDFWASVTKTAIEVIKDEVVLPVLR